MKNTNEFDLLGTKIRHFRQRKEYSQEYIASQLGLTQTSYSKIEKNASETSLSRLQKIADILEIQLSELLREGSSGIYVNENHNSNASNHGNIIIHNYPKELLEKLDDKLSKLLVQK
ncbi:MAG: helix-turn-helix transcriptional regulator [Bacteroidota bacterium]